MTEPNQQRQAGWNYRVIRQCNGTLAIHQTIYDAAGNVEMLPHAVRPRGETLEDLRQDYEAMGKAFSLPVLDKKWLIEGAEDETDLLPAPVRWELYQEPNLRLENEK